MAEYTPTGYRCVPTGTDGASVTSTSGAYTYSAWAELTSGLASDSLVCGLWAKLDSSNTVVMQIGVGAAASEVAIAEFTSSGTAFSFNPGLYWLPVPIPVAAGVRIAWRMMKPAGAAAQYAKLLYVPDQPATMSTTSVVPSFSNANIAVAPSGTPWANGSWVTVIASAPSDIALSSMVLATGLNVIGSEWEIDFGVGAAASEVVLTTLRWVNMQNFGNQLGQSTPMPLRGGISSGQRLAARVRSNQGSTLDVQIGVNYYPVPL